MKRRTKQTGAGFFPALIPVEISCSGIDIALWARVFVILGLAARTIRYILCFPLWPDEGFLAANFIGGSFSGLTGPLAFHQVSPLFFLLTEQAFVNLLGFNEYVLRLFPFICSLLSVWLFYRLAGRCLKGLPFLLALAIFSRKLRFTLDPRPMVEMVMPSLEALCRIESTPAVELWPSVSSTMCFFFACTGEMSR